MLHLAEGLKLPIDLATQTLLVVGKRGSGKSNTCVRLAEQFFKAKIPFVAIDPTDTWWGLKSAKDGISPGLGVYIFGGHHADLPLESGGGVLVADVIVDHRISAVLSMKHLSGRERGRFVSDFADRLFRRNTEPLHVFLEEAHEVAPQVPFKGEEEMLGRVTRLWKLGRSSGIGGSAISQRPASLSKNITTQAEILIVHRMLGPQDVAAVKEWIKYHGESDHVLSQLAELKTGEAWLWAPDFPEGKPIGLQRVRILERETFNSSATPKAGERHTEPKILAPVDLDALRSKMASTIERAKQEDPRELRKQIFELQKQLQNIPKNIPSKAEVKEIIKEVPVLRDAQIAALESAVKKLEDISSRLASPIVSAFDQMAKSGLAISDAIKKAGAWRSGENAEVDTEKRRLVGGQRPRGGQPGSNPGAPTLRLGERRMLDVLCRWYPAKLTKAQLATLSKLRVTSGTFSAYYGTLKRANLIVENGGVQVSEDGLYVHGGIKSIPQTTEEIIQMWRSSLRAGERKLLDVLVEIYPKGISREELAEQTDLTANAGTFSAYLGTLRRNGLAETSRNEIKAGQALFLMK